MPTVLAAELQPLALAFLSRELPSEFRIPGGCYPGLTAVTLEMNRVNPGSWWSDYLIHKGKKYDLEVWDEGGVVFLDAYELNETLRPASNDPIRLLSIELK